MKSHAIGQSAVFICCIYIIFLSDIKGFSTSLFIIYYYDYKAFVGVDIEILIFKYFFKLFKLFAASVVESINDRMPKELQQLYNLSRYECRKAVGDETVAVSGQVFTWDRSNAVGLSDDDGHMRGHS